MKAFSSVETFPEKFLEKFRSIFRGVQLKMFSQKWSKIHREAPSV